MPPLAARSGEPKPEEDALKPEEGPPSAPQEPLDDLRMRRWASPSSASRFPCSPASTARWARLRVLYWFGAASFVLARGGYLAGQPLAASAAAPPPRLVRSPGAEARCCSSRANVLCTAPLTVADARAWYQLAACAARLAGRADGDARQRHLRRLRHPRLRDGVPDPRARERHDRGSSASSGRASRPSSRR